MNVKDILINYRFYERNAEILRENIRQLEEELDGLKATDYSKDKINNNINISQVEELAIKIAEKKNKLNETEILIKAVKAAVEELEPTDKKIIQLKYMDKGSFYMDWVAVALEVNLSKEQCLRRRDKALQKIELVLRGVA